MVSGEPSATSYSNIASSRWSPNSSFNWSGNWIQFDFGMPVVIDEAILYHNGNAQPTGRAKWQGSNDGSTWTDIGTDFVVRANTAAPTTMTELNGNTTAYRYYRLLGVSGSDSANGYWQEITFKIDGFEPRSPHLPSYLNRGGWGDRAGVVSASSNFLNYMTSTPANLVNGSFADSVTGSWANSINANWAGNWIQFDFLTPIVVTEAQLFMNTGAAESGTVKWQGSNDASSWVDVSSNFTFSVAEPARRILGDMSGNTTAYRYYRLLGVSGTKSATPWWREIWFRTNEPGSPSPVWSPESPSPGSPSPSPESPSPSPSSPSPGSPSPEPGSPSPVASPASPSSPSPLPESPSPLPSSPSPADDIDLWVSQVPILVGELGSRPVRVSQAPILVLAEQKQPSRVSQVPIITLYAHKPVPLPTPIIPDVPVIETWHWLTAVTVAENGKEQRQRVREEPRYRLDFNAVILNDEDRRHIYNMLMRYLKIKFLYPFYQYNTYITATANVNDTKIYCDTSQSDFRVNEYAAVFDAEASEIYYVQVASIDNDGINTAEPIPFETGHNWQCCPAINFRIISSAGFSMQSVSGKFSIAIESTDYRDFVLLNDSGMSYIDNILIVKERPIPEQPENFDLSVEWFDNDTAIPTNYVSWLNARTMGRRRYMFDRRTEIGYWRSVANYFKGKQNIGLFPTFFDDLPISEAVPTNSDRFVTSNVDFYTFWLEGAYRYIRLETANGVKYRRISSVEPGFDEDGIPNKATVIMSQRLGNSTGDNQITKVSFMIMCRLDSDEVRVTHDAMTSEIEFSIKSVNA